MLRDFVDFIFGKDAWVVRDPLGKKRATRGRRAGILTQIIPRLHSITERLRLGTLWKGTSRTRSICK
jgi:hypothetical protein